MSSPPNASLSASFLAKRFQFHASGWLNRRIPPSRSITLGQKSIFIFPTKTGFAFLALLLVLLFGAINYQNALIFGCTFLMGSIFTATILHTYRNLAQLTFESVTSKNGHVGDALEFIVRISRPSIASRDSIEVGRPDSGMHWIDLHQSDSTCQSLYFTAAQRGHFRPGRLLVRTTYPLGLLRAWTWIDLNLYAVAYPRPIVDNHPGAESALPGQNSQQYAGDGEDYFAMRPYQEGDPVRHLAWRHYARTDQLFLQQFAQSADHQVMLDWDLISGDTEYRLSRLAGWAQQAHCSNLEFGLRLPALEIPPAHGMAHYHQVLTALALFPQT